LFGKVNIGNETVYTRCERCENGNRNAEEAVEVGGGGGPWAKPRGGTWRPFKSSLGGEGGPLARRYTTREKGPWGGKWGRPSNFVGIGRGEKGVGKPGGNRKGGGGPSL